MVFIQFVTGWMAKWLYIEWVRTHDGVFGGFAFEIVNFLNFTIKISSLPEESKGFYRNDAKLNLQPNKVNFGCDVSGNNIPENH